MIDWEWILYQDRIWKTNDGRTLLVTQMTLSHRFNTLRWMRRNARFLYQTCSLGSENLSFPEDAYVEWVKETPIYLSIETLTPSGIRPFVEIRNKLYDFYRKNY